MTLRDISNGPDWMMWVVFIIMVIITVILLLGKGSSFLAGFNTMSEKEQSKYDTKRLCRGMGYGFTIIDVLLLIMLLGEDILPAWFAQVFMGVVLVDIFGMIILANIKCKK